MTLIHGAGVDWPGPRTVTYSAPSRAKPPSPLKNSRSGGRGRNGGCQTRDDALRRGSRGLDRLQDALELLEEPATLRRQNDARDGSQKGSRFGRDEVGAQHEDAARLSFRAGLRTRLACPDQGLDRDLKLLDIGGLALVQDDEIDGELFHPPIFVRLQQFADDVDIFDIGDAQKHDRQIAGNALRPQTGLRAAAPHDRIRGRAQGRRGIDHMSREPLKQPRLARRHAEMVELHLSLRPRQHRGARERGGVAMLVDAVEQRCAAGGGDGPKGHANGRARRDADAAADREDRVEDGADRIRQRPAIHHGDGRANAAAAAEESRSVGFEFGSADGFAVDDGQMRGPDFRLARRPPSPRRQDRADVGEIFRLDEQFREGGMRDVGALRRQNEFGVGRDFDFARAAARIRDRDPANFRVVLARDEHVQRRRQRAVAARHLGAVLVEDHGIVVRLDAARLKARRPRHAAAHVLDEEVGAEVVAGRILAPARQRQIAPAAVSRAGRREHGGVAAVRKKMRGGRRLMRGGEPASAGRLDIASAGGRLHFRRPGARRRDVARHALLQQQFAGLDDRLGMEALPHRAIEQGVGDGDDRHALMMRHEGSHDGDAFALGHARRRIIQRIVEAVATLRADLGQTRQIGRGGARIDHRRQSGGVGRDHPVFAETSLQPEAGNAEVRILVSELQVAGVVGGFGYAPGQAQLRGVVDLPAHDQTVGLLEQASRRRAHDERGHQILEHRSRPRNQRGAVRDGRRGAAEPEPMLGRRRRLWRSRKSWRAAPRKPADRNNSNRARLPAREIRSTATGGGGRTRSRSPSPAPSTAPCSSRIESRAIAERAASADCARSWRCASIAFRVACAQNSISAPLPSPRSIASAPAMSTMISASAERPTSRAARSSSESGACRTASATDGERVVELAQGHGLGLAAVAQAGGFRAGYVESVGDAVEASLRRNRTASPFPARVRQRDQVSGQIAAVDGGHVSRVERAQIARVVPIVEVSAEALQAAHRRKRRLEPFDRLVGPDPAEVASADDGKEIEAEIGRRRPMRDRRRRIVLKIVGRQHVVGRRDESLEEPPGAARGSP